MNVYLDDLRCGPNNDWERRTCGWEGWVIVRSVENVKVLLKAGLVDNLSLDNDMGFNSMVLGQLNLTGKDLVLWMVSENIWPKGTITIHSENFICARDMKELIDRFRPKR